MLLSVNAIVKRFGGAEVLGGVDLTAEAARITGLIGPNGAGKSTLFSAITGFIPPDGGTVTLEGRVLDGLPPHRRAALGLVRTFQVPRAFADMSLRENLMFAPQHQSGEGVVSALLAFGRVAREERRLRAAADAMLDRLRLAHLAEHPARELSGGQRKLLELGRALMLSPRMLLVDEPFAGVAPALSLQLSEHFQTLRAEGMGLVVIEHDIEAIMALSDRIVVMAEGRVLTSGEPELVRRDPRVIEAYLGGAP